MPLFELATAAHLGGSVLLALFFLLLLQLDERAYLRLWAAAWAAQAIALAVFLTGAAVRGRPGLAVYLFLSTAHALLAVAAAHSFARGLPARPWQAGVAGAALLWALAAPPALGDVGLVHGAQQILLALAYLAAASLLWPLREPGGAGLRLLVGALGLVVALDAVQAAVFARAVAVGDGSSLYLQSAPFAVLLAQMVAGLGMALAVAEGAQFALGARESQLREVERLLKLRAETDALTGSASRLVFRDLVDAVRAEGGGRGLILLFDVDGMRALNEREGSDAGDDALRRMAAALRARTRPGDLLVRWGGDEFLVIVPGAARTDAEGRLGDIEVELGLAGLSARASPAEYGGGTDIVEAVARAEAGLGRGAAPPGAN